MSSRRDWIALRRQLLQLAKQGAIEAIGETVALSTDLNASAAMR
jgi:hypothetical protein